MRMRASAAKQLVAHLGSAAMWLAAAAVVAPATAQELSEKSVRTFMDYAWSLTPQKFTKPDGSSVLIDKANRDKMTVPVDKGRQVIMAGRLSAHAQICDLLQEQVQNYRSLMLREEQSNKWSPQQLIYINQLHLTTVMLLAGKIQLVEKDGEKRVVIDEGKAQAKTCTDEQRKKVKELIDAYVKAGPKLAQLPVSVPATSANPAAPAAKAANAKK